MVECKYQEHCEAYKFLIERAENPRCEEILKGCKLETQGDIAKACNIYYKFGNSPKPIFANKKPYITRQ